MKAPAALGLALALTVGIGCATTVTKAPRDLTLDLGEVPAGFRLTLDQENTAQGLASRFADASDKEARFKQIGFSGSWRKDYERDATSGATFIRSGATKFSDSGGASSYVTIIANEPASGVVGIVKLTLPEQIGDESHAWEFPQGVGGRELTTYQIVFRHANVSNLIIVSGPVGTLDRSLGFDLAKKQLAKAR